MKFLGADLTLVRIALVFFVAFLLNAPVFSQEAASNLSSPNQQQVAEWQSANKQMAEIRRSSLTRDEQCLAMWDIIWPLWKSGNLEARFARYVSFDQNWTRIKGRPNDSHIRGRDELTLFMHSFGSSELQRHYNYDTRWYWDYLTKLIASAEQYKALKECILEKATQECTQIAIQSGIIPTAEEYAAEIDMYLANGASVECPRGGR